MTAQIVGALSFPVLFALIALRVPIAIAMLGVGVLGSMLIYGSPGPVLAQFKALAFESVAGYTLSVVPLFLLMGELASRGGLSRLLFAAADALVGHRRGGVPMATIIGCAGFGAICGSSLATAATMGRVALPELRRSGTAPHLAAGTLAAGGTLGILVPPSIVLVIFASLTRQNVADLFAAAFVPAVLAIAIYLTVIAIYVRLRPDDVGPARQAAPARTRLRAVLAAWPVAIIFGLVMGGIYSGIISPTEAAAIGALATGLQALLSRSLTTHGLAQALLATAATTGMVFLILVGAAAFNSVLALSQLPQSFAAAVGQSGLSPVVVMALVILMYLVLGCVMDSLAMILLTVPVVFPMLAGLDFGLSPDAFAIWFGIIVLSVVEIGMVTPPIGMNLFAIQAIDRSVRIVDLYRGILPFLCGDILRIVLLAAIPALSLFALR